MDGARLARLSEGAPQAVEQRGLFGAGPTTRSACSIRSRASATVRTTAMPRLMPPARTRSTDSASRQTRIGQAFDSVATSTQCCSRSSMCASSVSAAAIAPREPMVVYTDGYSKPRRLSQCCAAVAAAPGGGGPLGHKQHVPPQIVREFLEALHGAGLALVERFPEVARVADALPEARLLARGQRVEQRRVVGRSAARREARRARGISAMRRVAARSAEAARQIARQADVHVGQPRQVERPCD